MSAPEVVSSHVNSEGERATVERVTSGPFAGRFLLVFHDDDAPPDRVAPMLLDAGTVAWLREALPLAE